MRIVVAMSGGVDSSVTAALLRREGHEVIGVTLQLYDHGAAVGKVGACCAGRDIRDAARVAAGLGVPHYVLDYEARFRAEVIDGFAASYAAGETPIPCIDCNRTVKFRDLLGFARDLGAEALASGHYAQRIVGAAGPELHRGAEAQRDQSYFLFATTREQLDFLRFPLGHLPKTEVRRMAAEFGLTVAEKPDSQDICFVPDGRYADLVTRLRPATATPGEIVTEDGRIVGRHPGIAHFTVGQRKGLGGGAGAPLHVLRLDAAANRVVVGPRAALRRSTARLRGMNWLGSGEMPVGPVAAAIRVRSTRTPVPASVSFAGDGQAEVAFAAPEEGVAPGQAGVLYDGTRVLGGGWIVDAAATSR